MDNPKYPKENREKRKGKKLTKGLDLFKEHLDRLTKDLKQFNERHRRTKEEIQRGGARKTTGRII
jgi:molecular chaperone GrpE (heat shock protein)